ncbi:hypothetical protein, partial [Pseudomonas syringae group genomosp. 7]
MFVVVGGVVWLVLVCEVFVSGGWCLLVVCCCVLCGGFCFVLFCFGCVWRGLGGVGVGCVCFGGGFGGGCGLFYPILASTGGAPGFWHATVASIRLNPAAAQA